ncbi:MAG: hypothetical protein JKY80_04500 [Mariprofundaceae bacterium]|nr:hypothetical protein [Mariprofundaceae bacterium]
MITRKTLKSLAGVAAFGRGRVGRLGVQKHGVQAKVSGQRMYEVRLTWKDGFDYQCNCPMGEMGDCCKCADYVKGW